MQHRNSNRLSAVYDLLAAFLCALAAFPYTHFKTIGNLRDKADVLLRGAAVLLSTVVFALVSWQYAWAVVGDAAYVALLLPLAVLLLDRVIVSSVWESGTGSVNPSLWALRTGLVLVSLVIVVYAILLGESALGNPEIMQLDRQIALHRKIIVGNEQSLQERTALENTPIENLRFADMERTGMDGLDRKTGVKIVGSVCGPQCKTYEANANAATRKIAVLDALQAENGELRQIVVKQNDMRKNLLVSPIGNAASVGVLIDVLRHADAAVILKIAVNLMLLLLLETVPLLFAYFPVSPKLRGGKGQ